MRGPTGAAVVAADDGAPSLSTAAGEATWKAVASSATDAARRHAIAVLVKLMFASLCGIRRDEAYTHTLVLEEQRCARYFDSSAERRVASTFLGFHDSIFAFLWRENLKILGPQNPPPILHQPSAQLFRCMRRRALSQRAMRNNYLLKAGHAHSRGGRHFILAAAAFLLPANLTLFPRRSCLSSSSTQRDSASPYSRISSSPSRGDEELQQDAERSRTSNSASGKMSDMRVGNSRARSKWSRKFLLASSSFAAAADAVPDIDAAASTGAHDEHEETAVESPSSDSNSPAETATSTSSVNSHMMCRDTSANDCREPFADDRKEGNGSHLSDEVLEATINTASPQSRWRIGRPHDMVRAVGRTVRLRLPSRGVTRWNRLWTGRGDALPRPEDETQDIRVGLPIVVATVAGGGVGGIPAGGGLTGSVGGDAADAKAVDGNIVVGTDDMDQDSGCTSTPDGASPAQPRQMLYDGEKVSTETWEKVRTCQTAMSWHG